YTGSWHRRRAWGCARDRRRTGSQGERRCRAERHRGDAERGWDLRLLRYELRDSRATGGEQSREEHHNQASPRDHGSLIAFGIKIAFMIPQARRNAEKREGGESRGPSPPSLFSLFRLNLD